MRKIDAFLLAGALAASPAGAEELMRVPGRIGEPTLLVRHERGSGPSVLYVHGATFPSGLALNFKIDGRSWADDLRARGYDVWSFDFAGYGGSDRPEPTNGAGSAMPLGRTPEAARQIERVADLIWKAGEGKRLSILAHSWGTLPAGFVASRRPQWLDRLVLFGPIARPIPDQADRPEGSYHLVSAADQWRSFENGRPDGEAPLMHPTRFKAWAEAYLGSDPTSETRNPPSVRVPTGPVLDSIDVRSGRFPYDPGLLRAPTLIVRGEWDAVSASEDAAWLAERLVAVQGGVRSVTLPRGGHRMHLETNRYALFDVVTDFLSDADESPSR